MKSEEQAQPFSALGKSRRGMAPLALGWGQVEKVARAFRNSRELLPKLILQLHFIQSALLCADSCAPNDPRSLGNSGWEGASSANQQARRRAFGPSDFVISVFAAFF
jgi:hypothetical protein